MSATEALLLGLSAMAGAGVGAVVVIRDLEQRWRRVDAMRADIEAHGRMLLVHKNEGLKIAASVVKIVSTLERHEITDEFDVETLRADLLRERK